MINAIENSNAPLCNYNLVTTNGDYLGRARLTKYEAHIKNFAFGLNHVDKRYELVSCEETEIVPSDDSCDTTHLILPE
jgi:hypothetical protein